MRNRLVPKWMTLTFVSLFWGRLKSCQPLRHIRHWISRKPLEIETWFQRTTNRKWPMRNPMAMWPMTSRDPERSHSWCHYAYSPICRKLLDVPYRNNRSLEQSLLWGSLIGYPTKLPTACFIISWHCIYKDVLYLYACWRILRFSIIIL